MTYPTARRPWARYPHLGATLALVATLGLAACGSSAGTPATGGDAAIVPADQLAQAADPATGEAAAEEPSVADEAAAANATTPSTASDAVVPASYRAGHLAIKLSAVAGTFSSPVFVTNAHDGSGRLYVVEQGGRIRIVTKTGSRVSTPFLDIHTRVSCCDERGLLGLAFHPSYKTNGKFYVDYTDTSGNTVVAEYRRSSTNSNRANSTGRILLRVSQPYANHNGGMLAFGPDGDLYIGLGDGGSSGDPGNRAQSKSSLLGKILRINVNSRTGSFAYGVPSTNPFVGTTGDDRIWSYGLRNPWRFSFDRVTGDLWIGDVGQDRYEEIDRAQHATGGGRGVNWGWRVLEGRACYSPPSGCSTSGKRSPLAVYSHTFGCAVVGGYVYRGSAYPAMTGAYLFGDDCSGRIWAVTANGATTQTPVLISDTALAISSFGESENGTMYVASLSNGRVYRIAGVSK